MTWSGHSSVPDGSATAGSEIHNNIINITPVAVISSQQNPQPVVLLSPHSNSSSAHELQVSNNSIIVSGDERHGVHNPKPNDVVLDAKVRKISCPSCGHHVEIQDQGGFIQEMPGLPAGVKFDPTDQEIVMHLEAKVVDFHKLHPLIDEFIPTLEGENGICYTHPEKLPGVRKDGLIRHFFHRPSKAYTTGTRKRRKVSTNDEGGETRWHKTGKTRPVFINGEVKGFKKILVLYTNYGRQRKPEKSNWVMHQYHIGINDEEKDGELVVSKVFYQTQPRQCGGGSVVKDINHSLMIESPKITNQHVGYVEFYGNNPAQHQHQFMRYGGSMVDGRGSTTVHELMQNVAVHGDGSSVSRFASNTSEETRLQG